LRQTGDARVTPSLTLATIWRLARPYFFPTTAGSAAVCSAPITIELWIVTINVMLNQWNNRYSAAGAQLGHLRLRARVSRLAAIVRSRSTSLYLNQWLQSAGGGG
jgi:ABC-type uncharacterized transport system fused permease/ATPase subunit